MTISVASVPEIVAVFPAQVTGGSSGVVVVVVDVVEVVVVVVSVPVVVLVDAGSG